MRVFLVGATGAIGRCLLPLLVRNGHQVTATARSPDRAEHIRTLGGEAVLCDVFEQDRLREAVAAARPDALIHQLTNLPKRLNPKRIKEELAPTNRLRTEGTRNLVDAAQRADVARVIAQSIAFPFAPSGASLATEEESLCHDLPAATDLVHAVDVLEDTVLGTGGIDGIVLRYGYFYGPGTFYATDGAFAEDVRRRRMPIVGDGAGVFSFIHVDDAAAATVAALERGEPGIYHIVDDEPAPVRVWLPLYAELIGAPPPRTVPKLLGRLAGGAYGYYLMTKQRGASNQKAKQLLGWEPQYPSWRDGFRAELLARQ